MPHGGAGARTPRIPSVTHGPAQASLAGSVNRFAALSLCFSLRFAFESLHFAFRVASLCFEFRTSRADLVGGLGVHQVGCQLMNKMIFVNVFEHPFR